MSEIAGVPPVAFNGSPQHTLGIEWEVALVDKTTRDLSSCAHEVIDAVLNGPVNGVRAPHVTKELLTNTVEIITGVHHTVGEAVDELHQTLQLVRQEASTLGAEVFCAGAHPFADWSAQQVSPSAHYAEIIERTQWWGRQMLIWGVHVHIGLSHPAKVFPILNALLLQYPHLLALSASSPFWLGADTGYASNRALLFQQLPTAGLPFQFADWPQFESFVHDQVTTGVFNQVGGMHWDIRPAPKWGTIEVRICDGISTRAELGALAALIHCLVVDLDRRLVAGETLPVLPPWHVQENKWRAARYGLDAIVITDAANSERLVTEDLDDLLNRLAPIASELGCSAELAAVADIPQRGASYQRQRRVAESTGNIVKVVDSLISEMDAAG